MLFSIDDKDTYLAELLYLLLMYCHFHFCCVNQTHRSNPKTVINNEESSNPNLLTVTDNFSDRY